MASPTKKSKKALPQPILTLPTRRDSAPPMSWVVKQVPRSWETQSQPSSRSIGLRTLSRLNWLPGIRTQPRWRWLGRLRLQGRRRVLAGLVAMEMDASTHYFDILRLDTAVWQCLPSTTVDRKSKKRNGSTDGSHGEIGCFGLTEPLVGSGAGGGLLTTANARATPGLSTGQKKWIGTPPGATSRSYGRATLRQSGQGIHRGEQDHAWL